MKMYFDPSSFLQSTQLKQKNVFESFEDQKTFPTFSKAYLQEKYFHGLKYEDTEVHGVRCKAVVSGYRGSYCKGKV